MSDRLKLHALLLTMGCQNVYYQSPSNLCMKYPCILYTINKMESIHADDSVYNQSVSYLVTIISKDPDCDLIDKISKLSKCSFDRRFISDNMYHTIFNLYY